MSRCRTRTRPAAALATMPAAVALVALDRSALAAGGPGPVVGGGTPGP